jgi:site-specific DNA recombinase
MGRYPNKAPFGYINTTTIEGKKIIALKQPEADILRWAFKQLAKNIHKIEDVRKMAEDKGLTCSRSHFFKIIRNPVYCGLIPITFKSGEHDLVKGTHDPLITETLFYEVQRVITTKKVITAKEDLLKETFFRRR